MTSTQHRKLQECRERHGASQVAISARTGISQPVLSRLFGGEDDYPDAVKRYVGLARELGTTLDYLLDDDQEAPRLVELAEDERRILEMYRRIKAARAIDPATAEAPISLYLAIQFPAEAASAAADGGAERVHPGPDEAEIPLDHASRRDERPGVAPIEPPRRRRTSAS